MITNPHVHAAPGLASTASATIGRPPIAISRAALDCVTVHPTDDSLPSRTCHTAYGTTSTTSASWGTIEVSNVLADEPNLMDMARRDEIVTLADVVVEGAPTTDALTMLVFVRRRADLSPESFHAYWRDVHGPIGAQIPGVRRYVQHHAIPNLYTGGREPVYDGVAQTWFDDLEAMRAAARTEERAATVEDQRHFIAAPSPFVVCTSVVMR